MTALPGEVGVKGTGEVILAVPLRVAKPWGGICGACTGFREFCCAEKSAQMSILVAALSWKREEEINEAAKMLSPCLFHGRQPSPS